MLLFKLAYLLERGMQTFIVTDQHIVPGVVTRVKDRLKGSLRVQDTQVQYMTLTNELQKAYSCHAC